VRRREEVAAAGRPKEGELVRIRAEGRFKGMTGTVLFSRKSRAFVKVEGFEQPPYVLISDLEKVEGGQ